MRDRLPEGWELEDGRNAATYASEHRDVHVELTHDELCVGTQESYRGSGDRTAAFIPLPVLLRLLEALEYKVIGPEDAAVLEAVDKVPLNWLRWWSEFTLHEEVTALAKLLLARCAAKAGTPEEGQGG